jgi:ABC-type antimicrobial peptide transport system permease subunit
MATSSPQLAPKRTLVLLPAIARLAWWRFKRMWLVLLVTWLGMLTMVMLVCAVPLFSQVAMTAGVRNALNSAPPYDQRITFSLASSQPTTAQIQQAEQNIAQVVNNNLASYTSGAAHFSVQMPALTITSGGTTAAGSNTTRLLGIFSYTMDQIANEITVVQGRLPQTGSDQVEIALTKYTAQSLGVHVGSVISANLPQSVGEGTWTMRVVGIFLPLANWESPNTFQVRNSNSGNIYPALASNSSILPKIAPLQVQLAIGGKPVFQVGGDVPFFQLNWSYPFHSSQVTASNAGTLSSLANTVQADIDNRLSNLQGTFFIPRASGVLFDVLPMYYSRIYTGEVVVSASLILILGLILFLVSMMTSSLIERQAATIATLRSRGATQRHVYGAFAVQGIGLGLAALLAGPFIAIVLIRLLVQWLFPASEQSAAGILTGNPLQAALNAGWYALVAVLIAVLAVIVAIRRASVMDILAFRRESARATRPSLWRRMHLDLMLSLLVCVGFAAYAYLTQSFFSEKSDVRIILGLLALVAPLLLLAAGITIFLRLFPFLLHMGTRLAMRRRGASAALAFAQMERAPRPAARMILLLALGTAFALFMLTSLSTQQQRVPDAAAFQVGADFSGSIQPPAQGQSLAQAEANYLHTAGVTSATLGYCASVNVKSEFHTDNIFAVDANTFARSASWSPLYSDQSLSSLMTLLVAHRTDAVAHDVVYVIVDDVTAKGLNLSVGSSFIQPTFDNFNTHFIVAAIVHAIPGSYSDSENYGLLVDYQSYANTYTKDSGGGTIAPNYAWLQTRSDATSLTSVRKAYPTLQDRRAMLNSLQSDSLHINIVSLLGTGIAVGLLLALAGTLFSAWMNASGRLTSFAVLRALGMVPRKIAAVLLWELGSVCAFALALGIGLGLLLTQLIMPVLYITDFVVGINSGTPIQVVVPTLLIALVLSAVVCICVVALALMARLVSRPSLSQTLRLNED